MKKLKNWMHGIQWANVLLLGAQVTDVPMLQGNKWVLVFQALVAALLPSLGGLSHKIAYGENQNPEHR